MSSEDKIKLQLSGFRRSLTLWMSKYSSKGTRSTDFENFFEEFRKVSPNIEDYPKNFKKWLAWNFSYYSGQTLPESKVEIPIHKILSLPQNLHTNLVMGKEGKFSLGRHHVEHSGPTRRKFIQILWDLMQSKSATEKVPKDMILQSYEDHAKRLSKIPDELDPEFLNEFKEFCRPIIREGVRQLSKLTPIPNNHSNLYHKRSEGGNFHSIENFVRKNVSVSKEIRQEAQDRKHPIIITIQGKPGVGKSTFVQKLVKHLYYNLMGFTQKNINRMAYYRNSSCKFWDGYKNQPITVLDDLFFAVNTVSGSEESAQTEFINLISDCKYIVPMADLRDKGREFTSRFIIITTNSSLNRFPGFTSCEAVQRRFGWVISGYHFQNHTVKLYRFKDGKEVDHLILPNNEKSIGNFVFSTYLQEAKFQLFPISDGPISDIVAYPSDIPEDLNSVEAYAICEPLKVRMITKPHPYTFILKPLQKALMKGLKSNRVFEPCYNPDYKVELELPENGYFLSGDYSNATDGLNYFMSQAAMETIQEELTRVGQNHLARVVSIEGGRHLVRYPKWTHIDSIVQTNGQLMGSLLSFPVLCYVNAFICMKALNLTSLDHKRMLIHGDDVLMTANQSQISCWERLAEQVGFGLSVGKCYQSKLWGSIDSRVYFETERLTLGGFKSHKGKSVDRIAQLVQSGFPKGLIVKYYKDDLKRTIRQLDTDEKYFGLSKYLPEKFGRFSVTREEIPSGSSMSYQMRVATAARLQKFFVRNDRVKGLYQIPIGRYDCFINIKGKMVKRSIDFDKINKELKYMGFGMIEEKREISYSKPETIQILDPYGKATERNIRKLANRFERVEPSLLPFVDSSGQEFALFRCGESPFEAQFRLLLGKVSENCVINSLVTPRDKAGKAPKGSPSPTLIKSGSKGAVKQSPRRCSIPK